jgi:ubiquinone/menaquinone biosynthesis C-methylase UbiE
MWNNMFQVSVGFNHKPNQTLVDAIKGRKPGTALDVAMGQGRNALYLASQGWKTTGVDLSDEGIKIAKDQAAKDKLKLDTIQTDLATFDFGKDRWDLVTLIYAGSDEAEIKKIQTSIKKGGLFVCEFFQKEATAGTGIGGFEHGQLAALFKDWKIVRNDEVEDIADWSMRKTKLVRFVAQKP